MAEATGTPNTTATPQANSAQPTEQNPQGAKPLVQPAGRGPDGKPTPSHSQSAVAAAAAEAKRKLKIDDQEVDEEEVIKTYKERKGHQSAANKQMQEGLKAKRQAEEFIKAMKDRSTLITALKKMGYKDQDLREISESYLASILEQEMLDPKERELRETKTKLQQYQELEKTQKEETEKKRDSEMKKKFAEDYSKQFVEALKTENLPPTNGMVAEMAKYIYRSAKLGYELTVAEAAKLVREDTETHYRHLYGAADPETLVKLLGEEGLKKVREYDTSRLKDPNSVLTTPPAEQQREQSRVRSNKNRMTPEEWRDFNRR